MSTVPNGAPDVLMSYNAMHNAIDVYENVSAKDILERYANDDMYRSVKMQELIERVDKWRRAVEECASIHGLFFGRKR